jgi:hypothetical protein
MIVAHMDVGPNCYLPCPGPAPSSSATPNSAVQLRIIEKVSQFNSKQDAKLQLVPRELAALTVRYLLFSFISPSFYVFFDHFLCHHRLCCIVETLMMNAALLL